MTSQASPFRTPIRAGRLRSRRSCKQRGIALITTLLLLILLSLLGLTMAVTANSDMLINSYYGNYRGSFYAADSGLNIARAAMINQIKGAVNMTACTGWGTGAASGCTSAPLNGTSAASTAQTYITSSPYNAFGSLNAGQATNSWPGNFVIPTSISGCSTSVAFGNSQVLTTQGTLTTSYAYTFNYTLCSVGRAQASQQVATKESGALTVTIIAQGPSGTPTPTKFSSFGKFTINFAECQGGLVPGTITGPLWTNGSWNFGTSGSYIFTDPVNEVDPNASFVFGGHCDLKNASSDTYNGQTIAPTFQAGFNRGQTAATIPTDSYSQKWAVIDGYGYDGTGHSEPVANPGPAQFNTYLKDINGASYPSGGASSGVFMPYCTAGIGCTPNTMNGGGIYVEGNAAVQLSLGTDVGGNPVQIYTITQGSTTTTVTLDINPLGGTCLTNFIASCGTTTIHSGSKTLVLAGVPQQKALPTLTEGAMLYVNGTVSSLSGPTGQSNQGVASIQDYYGTTITANGDINVTGDLIYKHEPVTLNTSDALVSGNDHNQVLGLFTANGNVVISSPYGNGNLETDASLAPIASPCPGGSSSCGFATSGSVNTWTIVGGQIQANVHGVSISTRNTWFDRRFTSRTDGFSPPWFPSTTVPGSAISGTPSAPKVQPTTQRLTWVTWPQ